jgi:hypothetical protein
VMAKGGGADWTHASVVLCLWRADVRIT